MKLLVIALLTFIAPKLYAQETPPPFDGHKWEAPYLLPVPEGWGVERFPLPPSFAPGIAYHGVEDIRFTPGWASAKNDEYWSYAFLWYIKSKVTPDVQMLDSSLTAYYTGLVKINGAKIPADKIIPVTVVIKKDPSRKNVHESFSGTVTMTDYMTQQPVTLNVHVQWRICTAQNETFIFFELSPKPLKHKVWRSLNKLWLDFQCDK